MSTPSRVRRVASLVASVALIVSGAVLATGGAASAAVAQLQERDRTKVVSADALPTIQLDSGYVWSQKVVGDTVYAVGSFSKARQAGAAAGGPTFPRSNVLAYSISTGDLLPFAPQVNGVVKAVAASPDGTRIYIGGSFNSVNGQARYNVAALDASSGVLVSGFNAIVGGTGVYSLVATNDALYAGGLFTQAGGIARKNLAAFSASTGSTLGWAPITNSQVDTMVMDPGGQKLIAGGRFDKVNNATQRGMAALDLSTGATLPWAVANTVKNGITTGTAANQAGIFTLTADASAVYGTGWSYKGVAAGNLEGTFAAEAGSGNLRWVADCHGDHYGVYSTGSVVYTTSHVHACDTMGEWGDSAQVKRYAEAYTADVRGTLSRTPSAGGNYKDWSGTPSPAPYNWYPDFTVGTASGLGQAGFSVVGDGRFMAIGGEFTSVNNRQFQGLVRFAITPTGAAKMGPRVTSGWTGSATSPSNNAARVTILSNYDRDDRDLIYDLYRENVSAPVASTTASAPFWSRQNVTLTETGLPGGTTQRYRVVARDPDGNIATSDWMSVKIAGTGGGTNLLPTAAFTSSVVGQAVSLDGSSSTDADGSIVSYSWNWGDGSAASTGVTASHTFASAGDHAVTLTVTDDKGGVGQTTKTITTAASTALASDDFERSVSSGWGNADSGGAWNVFSGSATTVSVSGGSGLLTLPAGATRIMTLPGASTRDVSATVRISADAAPSTGTAYAGVVLRQQAALEDGYSMRLWFRPDGAVWLVAQRGSTVIGTSAVAGLTRVAGDAFDLRVTATGANPTTLTGTVWRVGATQPAAPQLTVTDSTASVQVPGAAGVLGYRSSSASSTANIAFDRLRLTSEG